MLHSHVPKVFLTPRHIGWCGTNVIRGHCCVGGNSCINVIPGHYCATITAKNGLESFLHKCYKRCLSYNRRDRQTNTDETITCSSLIPDCEECIYTAEKRGKWRKTSLLLLLLLCWGKTISQRECGRKRDRNTKFNIILQDVKDVNILKYR
jgi:hypothetical protein